MKKSLLLLTTALAALTAVPTQAQNISVTVTYDLNDADGNVAKSVSSPKLIAQNGTAYKITYKAGQNSVVQVPAGVYDLYGSFTFPDSLKAKKHAGQALVVNEGLNLTTDTTLTLSLKSAIHHVGFEFVLPDGQKFVNLNYETTTDSVLTKPNGTLATAAFAFRHKLGTTLANGLAIGYDANEYTNGVLSRYGGIDVLVSDVSDNYGIAGLLTVSVTDPVDSSEVATSIGLGQAGCNKSLTLTNQASQYVTVTDNYRLSPLGETSPYTGGGSSGLIVSTLGDELAQVYRGGNSTYWPRRNAKDSAIVAQCLVKFCDATANSGQNFLKNAIFTSQLDYRTPKSQNCLSQSPIYNVIDGKLYAMVSAPQNFMYGVVNGVRTSLITPHPEFSYFKDQMHEDLLGNSVPVANVAGITSSSSKLLYRLTPTYVGRFGESRGTDVRYAHVTVAVDDSIVSQGVLNNTYINVTNLGKLTSGKLNVTIADSNAVVDDNPGQNITTLSVDLSKAQRSVPTLQMLQFRNTVTGKVTDRFDANSADAEIRLAAGSFYNTPSPNVQVAIPAKTQVSYSPSGKDEWKALEVTEEPANYRAVGFGSFYRGNLSLIDAKSDNKWYDLKVVITDDNGNVAQQLIEPAFSIEKIEGTGVNDVETAKAVQSVRYYDLTGRQSAEPTEGINIKVITYTDGTTRSEKVMK